MPPELPEAQKRLRAELAQALSQEGGLPLSLMRLALAHTRRVKDQADDLYQQTLAEALDPERKAWDYESETLTYHLGSIMNGLARNRWRSSYMKQRADFDEAHAPPVPAHEADPEGLLLRSGSHRRFQEIMAALLAGLADKPIALGVLRFTEEGVGRNTALAERIQCQVRDIVAAKQMLRDRTVAIILDRPSSQASQVSQVRA